MISDYLLTVARCPLCRRDGKPPLSLDPEGGRPDVWVCLQCDRRYRAHREGFVDLRPPDDTFDSLTDYAEEEFHHRAGALKPLFLSAKIKMDVMTSMLGPGPGDSVLDIGCGKGQFLYYSRDACKHAVGIDAGAHFAPEALQEVDLTRGDIRMLPFESESFDKAYSLDVLEHLDEDGVVDMLSEARRVLKPRGKLFLYSHVMMSSKLAVFQRGVNRLVAGLDRIGLLDNGPERERKSDHRNVLRSYEQLDAVLERTGFRIVDIRYYNVFFKALFEDLALPLVEHNLFRHKKPASPDPSPAGSAGHDHDHDDDHHHHHDSTKPDVGGWAYPPLRFATWIMKADVALFGGVRTGPFFLLLEAV